MKLLALVATLFLPFALSAAEPDRTWTSADGQSSFEGQLTAATENEATIRRRDGRSFTVTLDKVSPADRGYVAQFLARAQLAQRSFATSSFAEALQGEWVKIPPERYGLTFQVYGTKDLARQKEPVPLFVHLHGAGARAEDVEVGKVEIAATRLAWEEQYQETPCLIIVPLCPPDTYWGEHVSKLEAIIDELVATTPIDPNRIYLSGYSMGARGIASLLLSRPTFYAAAMFADGEASDEWVQKIDTPLWLWFSGERDWKKAEAVATAFNAAGKKAHFEGFPEFTHNQIHWKLAHDEEVFPWVFSQVRGSDPE